jgi:asparagine synthase (glutamine-hydrolysing)
MCGIWGEVGVFEGNERSSNDLLKIQKLLSIRGKDSSNTLVRKGVQLIHSRLRLSGDAGHGVQPVETEDGRYFILFNGEIYNLKELSSAYSISNKFGDTYLLERLVVKLGAVEAIKCINGMFAISIIDNHRKILHLSVDKYGQKPLFYRINNRKVVFGSMSKTVTIGCNSNNIRVSQLARYLEIGFVGPDKSIFKDVERVKPNSILSIDLHTGRVIHKEALKFNLPIETNLNIRSVFDTLIPDYLNTDFPVGTTLSGGIDSSLITYFYTRHYQGEPLAFTVNVKGKGYSEYGQASNFAKRLGIKLLSVEINNQDTHNYIDKSVSIMDEPNGDTSIIPTMALFDFSSKYVKCLLTGDGGDELYQGYNRHKAADLLAQNNMRSYVKKIAIKFGLRNRDLLKFFLNLFGKSYVGGNLDNRLDKLERVLSSKNMIEFYKGSLSVDDWQFSETDLTEYMGMDIQDIDKKLYLPGNNLTRMDFISLATGVESRSPMLDYRSDMASSTIPFNISSDGLKPLLKNLHQQIYPGSDYTKKGFSFPIAELINDDRYSSSIKLSCELISDTFGKRVNQSSLGSERLFNLAVLGLWIKGL